jgi:tetratricopeptide (TPR) repeat protein
MVLSAAAARVEAWVDYCDLAMSASLASGLTAALGTNGTHMDELSAVLAGRGPGVLIIDNPDRFVDDLADLLLRWREESPETRCWVASREVLRVPGERVITLEGLNTEDGLVLFRQIASRRGDVVWPDQDIQDIVRALEGNPLAIVMAASRSHSLDLDDLADLKMRLRGAPARHASLNAAVAWSIGRLDASHRDALEQCRVFRGGFTWRAANAVVEVTSGALETIEGLLDRSLIQRVTQGSRGERLRIPGSVGAYLRQQGELGADVAVRHAKYTIGRADKLIQSPRESADALQEVRDDLANLRAIPQRFPGTDLARRAILATVPVLLQDDPQAARRLLESCDLPHDGELALYEGRIDRLLGDHSASKRALQRAAEHGAPLHLVLFEQGRLAAQLLRPAAAQTRYDEAIAAAPPDVSAHWLASVRRCRGHAQRHLSRLPEAIEDYEKSRRQRAAVGGLELSIFDSVVALDADGVGEVPAPDTHSCVTGIAMALCEFGRPEEARRMLQRAHAELAQVHPLAAATASVYLALACLMSGDAVAGSVALQDAERSAGSAVLPLVWTLRAILERRRQRMDHAELVLARLRDRVRRTGDLRFTAVLRIMDGELSDAQDQVVRLVAQLVQESPSGNAVMGLTVDTVAGWFELDGGIRVDLSRRQAPKRILMALVADKRAQRGGLTLDQLVGVGWPGESVIPSAARGRVYVACSTLRKLGLDGVLIHADGSYSLDCRINPPLG